MRDIKFRAWDYDTNIMIYPDSKLETIFCFDSVGLSVYQGNGSELSSFELMQYTGLKDKNGVEIYEGDIIFWNNKYKSIVSYKNGSFVRSYRNGNIYLLYDSNIEDEILIDYKVIGNIYQNPYLLEVNRWRL